MRLVLLAILAVLGAAVPVGAANNFQRSPWIVDTAGPTPITTTGIFIVSVIWTGITTTNDKLILQDTTGRDVLNISAAAGEKQFMLNLPIQSNKGLVIQTINSGKAYIYFK